MDSFSSFLVLQVQRNKEKESLAALHPALLTLQSERMDCIFCNRLEEKLTPKPKAHYLFYYLLSKISKSTNKEQIFLFFLLIHPTHRSGLSEAQTESISPTSRVP